MQVGKEGVIKGIASVISLLLILFWLFGGSGSSDLTRSVELGFTATSPAGDAGGRVVPASCPSFAHFSGECDPPTFGCEPDAVNQGDSCSLSWSCVNSSSSSGVNFSTGGATSGSVEVTPDDTTTYTVVCSNGGQASEAVTVLTPELSITATPDRINAGETSSITWSASSVNEGTCGVTENNPNVSDSFSGDSGTQTTSALSAQTTYTLTCETDAGSTSASATVTMNPSFEEF